MISASFVTLLLTTSESAAGLSNSFPPSLPRLSPPPLSSVQIGPEHQAVAKATNQESQQVDRGDDEERGGPVAVVTEERESRSGGGEEACVWHLSVCPAVSTESDLPLQFTGAQTEV